MSIDEMSEARAKELLGQALDVLCAVWDDWTTANDSSGIDGYQIKDVSPETVKLVHNALLGHLPRDLALNQAPVAPSELADFLKSHQQQVAELLGEIDRLRTSALPNGERAGE
jgi:hypothetical protein